MKFYDINKFPPSEGILLFPISMSRISNSQNPKKCFEYIEYLTKVRKAIVKPWVGLNIVYGDFLYLHSNESANKLRSKYLPLIISHKNQFLKILKKNPWYIDKAFSFSTWNQLLLESKDFINFFGELKKIYQKDKLLQEYIKKDCNDEHPSEDQVNFILEESLLFYLISKGEIKLQNEFVNNHQKWTLLCYPGPPLYSEIYLYQKNFFNLENSRNRFEFNYYDLEKKVLYDFSKIILKSFSPK